MAGCELPKFRPYHKCRFHWLKTQSIDVQIVARDRRLAAIPVDVRRKVVPARLWPKDRRWCAGCQSFVPTFYTSGSRCKACASSATHAARIEKVYGIDADEYERLFKLQGGRCAICRAKPKKTRLAVDHSHDSGANRGLLCKNCNHDLLGAAHDNVNILRAAVAYMEHPPTTGEWVAPEESDTPKADPEPGSRASKIVSLDEKTPTTPQARKTPLSDRGIGGMSVSELELIGGSSDENGRYRLYQRRDDERIPF